MKEDLTRVTNRLKENIKYVPIKFLNYPEGELKRKPAPDKWSKKELLGHLIDSAVNNHLRFVKAQFSQTPFFVDGYAQNDWVRIQNYNERDAKELVNFWKVYNEHILFIMQNTPAENLEIVLNAEDPFENADNLFLLMKDYVDHMDHHLNKIFNK